MDETIQYGYLCDYVIRPDKRSTSSHRKRRPWPPTTEPKGERERRERERQRERQREREREEREECFNGHSETFALYKLTYHCFR